MKFQWKRVLAVSKQIARFVGAVGTFVGAMIALAPKIYAAWTRLVAWSSPYLDVLAPYRWFLGLVLLGLAVYFAVTIYNARMHHRSVLTVLASHLTLEIHDAAGKSATLLHHTQLRADVDDVEAYRHRIWGSGDVPKPDIKLKEYDSRVSDEVTVDGGMTCYEHIFMPPLRKGTKVWQIWKSDAKDCFTKAKEYLSHVVVYREKDMRMTVLFPHERPPKKAVAVAVVGHSAQRMGELEILPTNGGTKVELRVENPTLGQSYRIEWEW
jgi:hypothetical protein